MNSLKELQLIAGKCGISSSGTKFLLHEKIIQFYHLSKGVNQVISIDMGTKNLALTEMSHDFCVHQLKLVNLDLPEVFDPKSFTTQIRDFLKTEVDPRVKPLTACLIERQRCRTMGSRAIPESILRVNFVEILLHYHLQNSAISVSPERVSTYFSLPKGREKKAAAVRIVKLMMEQGRLHLEKDAKANFETSKKQDDLSDSILQAISFFEWRQQAAKFYQSINNCQLKEATK